MSINRPLRDMAGKYDRDDEAAVAGTILYNSFNGSSIHDNSHSQSILIQPSAEVLEDPHVTKCCRMSAVRRTFCLVVLFDLILTFILWLLYTELTLEGDNGEAFKHEVLDYDFHESMFDSVWMSTVRFFILILSYALYRSRKPWLVAVSTFLTCTYVLCKVFLFNWTGEPQKPTTPPLMSTFQWGNGKPVDSDNTFKYLLILLLIIASVVISWVEVWLLDFRVLPLEQRARERAHAIQQSQTYDERTPLLRDQYHAASDYQSDRFYSPIESRAGSDDEDDQSRFRSVRGSRGHSRNASNVETIYTPEEQVYIKTSKEALDRAWGLFKEEEGWSEESGKIETGMVSGKQVKGIGKVFKLVGLIDLPPKAVFEEIVFNFENQLSWNNTVTAAEIILRINDSTDVTYNIAAEALGGMVSTRDFVNVRHWTKREGAYVMGGVAGEHPSKPVFKEHIRGQNNTSAWIVRNYKGDQNKTEFFWIMNVNLKGWMPQTLIDQALSGVMRDFLKALQARCRQIAEEQINKT